MSLLVAHTHAGWACRRRDTHTTDHAPIVCVFRTHTATARPLRCVAVSISIAKYSGGSGYAVPKQNNK